MRIVFFGSDDFAAVHLHHLLNAGHEIVACVTGPDRAQGRGMKMLMSPIKRMALDKQIPYLQPLSLKEQDTVDALKSHVADIFVVVAYGRLLTQEVLNIPKMLCLNVHGSLLPKYRGAAPVNWAILNGERETGVTIQKMALALDAGEIIAQEVMSITDEENAVQLRQRMALVGAKLLVRVLNDNPSGAFTLKSQDESQVTWASKLTKEMGLIDWNRSAKTIVNQVRGLQPWPGAYTSFNSRMIKILGMRLSKENVGHLKPGQVITINKDGFHVACADEAVLVTELQPEAGKVMSAISFVAGYKIAQGASFI